MDLYNMDTVKHILSKNGFSISKNLGQNFIIDPTICPKIISLLDANSDTGIIEIGPGIGTLTKELLATGGTVLAIEADKRLPDILKQTLNARDNLIVLCADFLKTDLKKIVKEYFQNVKEIKICSNVPYYITTPIITHILKSGVMFDDIILMVQKETAERITASIPSKNSSSITVMVNYYAKTEMLFPVSSNYFYPEPKVDSAVIRITPRKSPAVLTNDESYFFKVVNATFIQRRKTLANAISNTLGFSKSEINEILLSLNIKENTRPEELSLSEFALLADELNKRRIDNKKVK